MKNSAALGFEGGRMTREKSMIGSSVDLILDLINLVLLHFRTYLCWTFCYRHLDIGPNHLIFTQCKVNIR